MKNALTADRLREILHYDPDTGIFVWRVAVGRMSAGYVAGHAEPREAGRIVIWVDGHLYKAHRLAWLYVHGRWPDAGVDHRDRDPSHNWISNLREATQSQNNANQRKSAQNKSGAKGVCWERRRQKWVANLKVGGRKRYLGQFATVEAAQAAYMKAARDTFGDFAFQG